MVVEEHALVCEMLLNFGHVVHRIHPEILIVRQDDDHIWFFTLLGAGCKSCAPQEEGHNTSTQCFHFVVGIDKRKSCEQSPIEASKFDAPYTFLQLILEQGEAALGRLNILKSQTEQTIRRRVSTIIPRIGLRSQATSV